MEAQEGFLGTWNSLPDYSLSLSGTHAFLSLLSACQLDSPASLCGLALPAYVSLHSWLIVAIPWHLQLPDCQSIQFSSMIEWFILFPKWKLPGERNWTADFGSDTYLLLNLGCLEDLSCIYFRPTKWGQYSKSLFLFL